MTSKINDTDTRYPTTFCLPKSKKKMPVRRTRFWVYSLLIDYQLPLISHLLPLRTIERPKSDPLIWSLLQAKSTAQTRPGTERLKGQFKKIKS